MNSIAPKYKTLLLHAAFAAMALMFAAQLRAEDKIINAHDVEFYLASPELGGRLTGTDNEQKASAFLAKKLEALGAAPLPGAQGFLLPFDFTAGLSDGGSSISLGESAQKQSAKWDSSANIQGLSLSENGETSGSVVFAGYGIHTNKDAGYEYDSFEGLEVKGKILLVFRYFPEDLDQEKRQVLSNRAADLRTKALNARERGAKAILVTYGPTNKDEKDIIPLTYDSIPTGSGIIGASISNEVALKIFQAGGKTKEEYEEIQRRLDKGDPKAKGFELPGAFVSLNVKIQREKKIGHNVVGYFPANGGQPVKDQWIGFGAHYDHLGDGKNVANSLARKSEEGKPHVGADDNASGVTASLLAAEKISKAKRNRPIFVGFWSGEEIGLLGSTHFAKHGPVPAEKIAAYINLDMVGRLRDNKLIAQGVGSSADWKGILDKINETAKFTLSTVSDPYNPSDSSAFYLVGVPTVFLFTGTHEDYHRPSDTPDKINYEGLARVGDFTAALAEYTANLEKTPKYVKAERASGQYSRGGRSGLRASTGVIPDFSSDVKGLRLSGVVEGAPAQKAGLKEGDVIVEVAGRKIANIYDYMNVLESLKPGVETKISFERDGKIQQASITPARK